MNKKTIFAIIVILVILVISIIILYFKEDYSNVNVKTVDIMSNISENLDDDMPPMLELDEQGLKDTYNIDIEKVEDYIVEIPIMNVRANEIAIIKVNNRRDVQYIKNKFNERVEVIKSGFDGYLQDQLELAINPLIISKGKYVLMSISERNDDIEKIFNSYFSNN